MQTKAAANTDLIEVLIDCNVMYSTCTLLHV